MCERRDLKPSPEGFIDNENFKSCFARSVAVNSQYKQAKTEDLTREERRDSFANVPQESPVRYRKNNRAATMDESRRFSCGSIVSRRASVVTSPPKRNEIPVENIYNQNKIETLQWQMREIEKSRAMYKAVVKQIVTFLEKAHVSLEHLGSRLNRKNSVPRSKSEHHIVSGCETSTQNFDDHISSWNPNKKQDNLHPDEIPPEKLSQEAFRLLRTAQSLLSTQEPNLTSSESLNLSDDPSDIEFLAQLAKEFPSDSHKPQRATSFSLSPKLILPDADIRISTAFNRKLSLQLGRNPDKKSLIRCSVAESECYSLPPPGTEVDPLRVTEFIANRDKTIEKTLNSPATSSISSTEDESGFSSMNSFQDVGLPIVNSTAIEEVSARTVLLKSMLHHNNNDFDSLESTLIAEKLEKKEDDRRHSLSDVKLWQKPTVACAGFDSPLSSQANHKRWHSSPEQKSVNPSLKVLWV